MKAANLFGSFPSDLPEELVEVLAEGNGHVRIVRLVSQGHSSPDGFWYDQDEHEWFVLLQGEAVMTFEKAATGEVEVVSLRPGDWIEIAPHVRHRIESTDAGRHTIWLAVHWG